MEKFDFTKTIEKMSDKDLKTRISAAYEQKMPAIRPVPYRRHTRSYL